MIIITGARPQAPMQRQASRGEAEKRMSSRVCKIPFQGTENQERELRALIQRLRGQEGALMPA